MGSSRLFCSFCRVRDADDLPSKPQQLVAQHAAGLFTPFMDTTSVINDPLQCPPIATIWVYTILQLELGPSAAALATVGVWAWWAGERLVFN